jgi:thiamine biosynthesis lipoprotein
MKLIAAGEVPSYTETRLLMGTLINLTVVSPEEGSLTRVVEDTFSEMQRLIAVYDHRSATSEVGRLNLDGKIASPSAQLLTVIEKSTAVAELTGGAFDITIKPALDAFQNDSMITDEIKSQVDYRLVSCSTDRIWFEQPGVQITLDGIAKGAVIDAGVAVLKNDGFNNVMVEAGGDLMAAGSRGSGEPWKIGINHPREAGQTLMATLGLNDRAAATSGDYQFYFSEDLTKNHIIDPVLFESPKELASVTVLAPSAVEADAFSTAIMVMGSERGLALVESLPGLDAYLVTKDLRVLKSSGFTTDL